MRVSSFFNMLCITRTLVPLILFTSSAVCFSVVETPNNLFVKQPNYHVTDIGKGGSSSLRTRHINLNNNNIANKPIIKTDFHIVPYVATTLVDSDLFFDPVTSQFVSRRIPKRTHSSHADNTKKLTDYYKTLKNKPKTVSHIQNQNFKNKSNVLPINNIKFKYPEVQPHSFSQKISFFPSPKTAKPKSDSHKSIKSQKSYKDNKTYEPNFFFDDFLNKKPPAITKTLSNNGHLKSDHEIPKFIPVKPIYPGEGKWALRGKTYKPYVGKQIYSKLNDDTEHPEAEEIFQDAKIIFNEQKKEFPQNFLTPGNDKVAIYPKSVYKNKNKNIRKLPLKSSAGSTQNILNVPENIDNSEKTEETSEEQEQEFVPTRTLAQVRQYENEEHNLPPIEPRLREIVKDSKTHTVFTEEGYEDMAYDHADHEKNAEKGEESEELHESKDILRKGSSGSNSNEGKVVNSETKQISQIIDPKSQNNSSKVIPSILNNTESTHNNFSDTTEKSPIIDKFKKENGFRTRRSAIKDDIVPNKNTKLPSKLHEKANPTYYSQKYPYYDQFSVSVLNNNSPLRYAENFKNRPKKKVGKMSFYEHAQRKKCREAEEVQPIPKRIEKKAQGKDNEELEDPQQNNGPKIKNLGDAIECFRAQLFGENPLDNPLFSEKFIAEPTPIFQDLESMGITPFFDTKEIITPNGKNKRNRRHLIDPTVLKSNDNELHLPEKQALHGRRKSVKRRIKSRRKYPRTPLSVSNIHQKQHSTEPSVTVLPKYKIISEVQYKDDIKPNEQLNVFTDVIKNIKLSSGNIHDTDTKASEKIKITTFTAPKKNKQNISFQTILEDEEDSIFDSSDINTIVGYQSPKSDLHRHKPFLDDMFIKDRDVTTEELFHKSPITTTVRTNNFFILGMKPPPPLISSSLPTSTNIFNRKYYRNKSPNRRWNHRILKRNAAMPTYSQIRRKSTIETTTETDDYIPRRNRNYHYDEKSGKIIYYTTQASVIEEIEPVITTEQYIPPKRTVTEKAVKITAENQKLKGPSFLEFVSKLKSHEGYISIPDPKPIKIDKETSTTTTTEKAASTTEPEFLRILKNVRNDPDYKEIGENKTTTTTPTNEEEQKYTDEEEVLQSQNVPIKNSPGSSVMTHLETIPNNSSLEIGTLKIFDINEYIPRPRNYTFSSFINTSKYSTIKRNPVVAKKEDENEDSIKNDDTENIKIQRLKAEYDKTEETTTRTVEHINKDSDEEKPPISRDQEKLVREEPKRNNRRLRTKARNQRINRDEEKDRKFRDEITSEKPRDVEPKRSVRRFRIRPKPKNEYNNETQIIEEAEKQDTKETQSYESIRNRRSWNKPMEKSLKNYENRSNRRRREEPRYVTETDTPDLISSSVSTVVPEITAPTIRSRGRARHRTSYRTTPAPRFRRGRRTRPTHSATTAYHTDSITTPYSVVSKRRRRPISRISSSSAAPPLQSPLPVISTENNSNVSNQNEKTSTTVIPSTPLTLATVELESEKKEIDGNTGGFSHVSARKVQDVEVFKDYDKTQKHGGNYKGINDADVVILNPDEVEEAKQSLQKVKITEGPLVLDLFSANKEAHEDQYLNREEKIKGHNQRDGSNQLQNYDKKKEKDVFEQQEILKDQIKPYEVVENKEIEDNSKEESITSNPTNEYTDREEEKKITRALPKEEYLKERTESRRVGPQIPANPFFGQEELLLATETTTPTAAIFHSTSVPSNFDEENDKLVVQVFDLPSAQEISTTAKTIELETLETASYLSGEETKQPSHQQQQPQSHQQQQQSHHQHQQQQQEPLHQQQQEPLHQQQQEPLHQQQQEPLHQQQQEPLHQQQHPQNYHHHHRQQKPHQQHRHQQYQPQQHQPQQHQPQNYQSHQHQPHHLHHPQQQHQPQRHNQHQPQQHQNQPPQQKKHQSSQKKHQPPQHKHQIYNFKNDSNQTNYNGNSTQTKTTDETVISTISPDYVLNSGGRQFIAKEAAPVQLDNYEALPKKTMVDFTDPPIIHRTVKKRIRIKPNNFDFTTTTPVYEEYQKPKESVSVKDDTRKQQPIKDVNLSSKIEFENGNDTIPNHNVETSTNIYNNNQFDRNPTEPIKDHQKIDRNEYYKQETLPTTITTTPIYFDPKYATKMPNVQQQEEIEAPPKTFYQANKEDQLPLYAPNKEEQPPKDPYIYRQIDEERPKVPVNTHHGNHKPVKKYKNSPERINTIVSSTEKFFFIKDPSKRNYFYAPI